MLLLTKTVIVVVAVSLNVGKTAGNVLPKFGNLAEYHPKTKRDLILKNPDDFLKRFFGSKRDQEDWTNVQQPAEYVDVGEPEELQLNNVEPKLQYHKNDLLEKHPFSMAIATPSNGPLNKAFRANGKTILQDFSGKRMPMNGFKLDGTFPYNSNNGFEKNEPETAGGRKPDLLDDIMGAKGLFGKRSQVYGDVGYDVFAQLSGKDANVNHKVTIKPQKYKLQAFMGKRLNENLPARLDGGNGVPFWRNYGILKKGDDLHEHGDDELILAHFGNGKTDANAAKDILNKNVPLNGQIRSQKNYWMDYQAEMQNLANENARLREEKKWKRSMSLNLKAGVPRMNIYMG